MKVNHCEAVAQQPVEMEGSHGCQVRWLLGEKDGTPNFAMRQFEVAPGGYTPRHSHPYEHEVFVLEGEGLVFEGEQPHRLRAGDVVLVKPDEVHQFRNAGSVPLKFLCLVPNSATGKKMTVAPECGIEASTDVLPHPIVGVTACRQVSPFVLSLEFDDGGAQTIDFEPVLYGNIFGALRDPALFAQFRIDPDFATLVWPNDADFDPATLRYWPEYLPHLLEMVERWKKSPSTIQS